MSLFRDHDNIQASDTHTVIQKYSYILSKIELFTSIQEVFYVGGLQPAVLQ